jgi:hypothetical protein
MVEGAQDLAGGLRVRRLQVAQGLVGEHHAPAEGVVRLIALDHRDVVGRVLLFHQEREIQPGGSAANADDFHVCVPMLGTSIVEA